MSTRLFALLIALLLPCASASATWSIVLVDTATGEVAVGTATCLTGLDLQKYVPVIVVGKGAAAAQAAVDGSGQNRKLIFAELQKGTPPAEILQLVKQGDFQKGLRQYGIVDLSPAAVGFTGQGVGEGKLHVTGSVGTVHYAIQGNVLAGGAVVLAARDAVEAADGLLSDRLMAGMLAAHLTGGDGRCSCPTAEPTDCGAPPASFEKSAHIAFAAAARVGDMDGICAGAYGCANGQYWMRLNVANQGLTDPDPTVQLLALYADFRAAMEGRPDGLNSGAVLDCPEVLGDGQSVRHLDLRLADLDGAAVPHGGAQISVEHAPDSAGLCSLVSVQDHGDGRYRVTLQAGEGEGTDRLLVRVDDGVVRATLHPLPELVHRPALRADAAALSLTGPDGLLLDVMGPSDAAGRPFTVYFSFTGTAPAHVIGGVRLPLAFDRLLHISPLLPALGVVGGSPGVLDDVSAARVTVGPKTGALAWMSGWTLWSAWVTMQPTDFASNAVEFQLVP